MHERLLSVLQGLRKTTVFEDAASIVLPAAMEIAARPFAEGGPSGRILRAMVHHRPSEGYRRLAVSEAESANEGGLEDAFLPSATAWQWMIENQKPASIDVNLALIQAEAADGPEPVADVGLEKANTSQDTRARLLQRGATHVLVVPLLGLRGTVEGLISIEAHCPSAIGQSVIWAGCTMELELLGSLATPFLLWLPEQPRELAEEIDPLLPVVGKTMAGLVRLLKVFREQRETLLLSGPTGSGKSRLARWCHLTSQRRAKPFEVLDLSSVPEDLQMGELFGWRRGAFTGATRDNVGAIGRAEGGTLFIDEIDKLSLRAQAGLLHVLEERTYRPLGDSGSERAADVRFIVGTNVDLREAVKNQTLREDLYYRINVLPITIPPLAERRDEIGAWARFMLGRCHEETQRNGRAELDKAAIALLESQPWPGNVRQLDNIVRRAYALAVAELGGMNAPLDTITVGEEHILRALQYESPHDATRFLPAIHAAATEFVAEAKRHRAAGGALDLDHADAFKGFVLAAALEEDPDRDRAFSLFGKDALAKSRNHHKVLRREIERAHALCSSVKGSIPWRVELLEKGSE